ncbi:hypothetical protein CC86DRAFT_431887 [Ophiobolus disseminans]|uniref:Rhodopsin domain-containing protein n=1 Tax=Ophiobolus disseminans TaxID=1469910 RepID=A0A6A6ZGK1_9PLEO|nr:hypothetical protein CC86DRAFT_431887 [Ophiobolus disseminans]
MIGRLLTRGCLAKKFGLDDFFIALAVILGGAQTMTIIMQVEHGRGRHSQELHVEDYNKMLLYTWVNMLVYFVANWAVKMSILALYYRIGSRKQGLPRIMQARAVWVTTGLITALTVATFLTQLFACTPMSRVWDVEKRLGGCINSAAFMQASAAFNVVTDVILLIFPLPLLPLLKFNKKQRTALAMILSIGLIPVVASTMRLCEIVMSGNPMSMGMSWKDADSSWTWAWVPVWSQIEVSIGIFAASLPSLNPLLKHAWTGFATTRPSTPSQLSDFPNYQGTADSLKSMTGMDRDLEKSLKVDNTSYYDDTFDDEEEIGVAKTANARIAVKAGGVRTVYIKT